MVGKPFSCSVCAGKNLPVSWSSCQCSWSSAEGQRAGGAGRTCVLGSCLSAVLIRSLAAPRLHPLSLFGVGGLSSVASPVLPKLCCGSPLPLFLLSSSSSLLIFLNFCTFSVIGFISRDHRHKCMCLMSRTHSIIYMCVCLF